MPRIDIPGLPGGGSGHPPRTVEWFLTTNRESLAEPAGGLQPHEAEALQALYAELQLKYAPPVMTGLQLYEQLAASHLLSTGCASIDSRLLNGGMRPGQMLEICGESASGKTQLCLAAAAQAARSGLRVVYVDTSNAVRGRRLAQVVQAQQEVESGGAQGPADPLKFIEVRRCYDVHALLHLLDQLMRQQAEQQVQQQAEQQQQQAVRRRLEDLPVSLLLVDCLSALIAPILGGGQHSQGHALLAAAATSLKAFAAKAQTVVLVTNHTVGGSGERRHEKRPAMGESWRDQPHTRIQLSLPPPGSSSRSSSSGGGAGQCTATLRTSTMLPAGMSAAYTLGAGGLSAWPPPAAATAPPGGRQPGGAQPHPQPMQH